MRYQNKEPNIIKNYFYNLSYRLLAILVPLISTPYVARVLKAESLGSFSFIQSIATYFSIFGIMGLNLYGQLQISKNRTNTEFLGQEFSEILVAKTITSLISAILYVCFIIFYGKYLALLIIMGSMMIANIIDISWLFQGLEQFKKIAIRDCIIKLLGLILILLFVKKEDDVLLYAVIIQGSTLLGNLSLWYKVRRFISFKRIKWNRVLEHISNCLVYFIPSIATTIYTSTDKVMLGAIVGSNYQNGIYDQAHKIEQVIITIISSMSTVLLPRLAFLHSNKDGETLNRYIGNAISVTGLVEIPIMIGLFSIAEVFIPVFLGDEFVESIGLIRIFSVLILFSGLNSMLGNSCLVAQGKQKKYNIGVFGGAITNIILNAILIPFFESKGAAVASLFSEITVFTFFLCFAKNEFISLKEIGRRWIKYFLSAAPMGVLVWKIGNHFGVGIITMIIQVVSGIIIYGAFLIILRDEMIVSLLKGRKKL